MRTKEEILKRVMVKKSPFSDLSGYIDLKSTGRRCCFEADFKAGGFEHVSISIYGSRKLPTWEEMSEVKEIFWEDEEEVVQIHPKMSSYVNIVEVLHLWRPTDGNWNRLMNGTQ